MIPVLDKGYVQILGSTFPGNSLAQLFKDYGRRPSWQLANVVTLTLAVKCPLFVQLTLAEQGLICVAKRPPSSPEAYIPTSVEIGSPNLEANIEIAEYFKQTTESLLINQQSFKLQQCDGFVTQVLAPISLYNELVVSGSLSTWIKFISLTSLPSPIEAYREAVNNLMKGEWPQINDIIRTLT